ncbi:MAG: helix-turn-helix domain-containing protein [Caulobacteraceae bacterium]
MVDVTGLLHALNVWRRLMATSASLNGPEPVDVEVGLTIRHLRKSQGISQQTLAAGLGLTFQQVQKYERGTNRISASMLVKAAGVLGVQPADLLPRTESPPMAPQLQRAALLGGAQQLLDDYAAIKSVRRRKAVVALVRALKEAEPAADVEDD